MKKYKVYWEVSKYAIVEAKSEEEAIEKVHNSEVEEFEDEITASLEAREIDEDRSCVKCGKTSDLLDNEDICYTCAKERGRI